MNWTVGWKQNNLPVQHICGNFCNSVGKNFLNNIWFPLLKERHEYVRLLYPQKVATLMSQKFGLNFVQQNDSMISFLSAIVYLFYVLISECIETLNCLNFSKNWKNGCVLKLLTGRVYVVNHRNTHADDWKSFTIYILSPVLIQCLFINYFPNIVNKSL